MRKIRLEESRDDDVDIKVRFVKSFLDVIIAFLLEIKGSLSGYRIIENIYIIAKVLIPPSTIYPLFRSMEKRGLIERLKVKKNGGIFRLTVNGEKWLHKTMGELTKIQVSILSTISLCLEKRGIINQNFTCQINPTQYITKLKVDKPRKIEVLEELEELLPT